MEVRTGRPTRVRIALYCHNRFGLGHIIRSIRIAEKLEATGLFEPVILTGCRTLDAIEISPRIAVHRLTPIPVDAYDPKLYQVLAERIVQIKAFMKEQSPDMLVVDSIPLGFRKELREVLQDAADDPSGALCVLGLPYPYDGMDAIAKNRKDLSAFGAYRQGMIYSDDDEPFYRQFPFPLQHVGIVAAAPPPPSDPSSRTILVLGGGGAVSLSLVEPLIEATEAARGKGYHVRFIVGPLADFPLLEEKAKDIKGFELVSVSTVEDAVRDACLVISRCGYNTAATLIRTSLPIIFIPYWVYEGDEQRTRARELANLKNIILVEEKQDNLGKRVEEAIETLLQRPVEKRETHISFEGAERATEFLTGVAAPLLERKSQSPAAGI